MAKNGNIHPTRIFKKPQELKKVFEEYKKDLKEREKEWLKIQYVGKEGSRVTDSVKLPLTYEGLKRYCYDTKIGSVEQYFINKDDLYNDFVVVCRAIKNEIRENQIIGGMNGFFNPSITQRLNGLKEQTETVNTTTIKPLFLDDSLNDSDQED